MVYNGAYRNNLGGNMFETEKLNRKLFQNDEFEKLAKQVDVNVEKYKNQEYAKFMFTSSEMPKFKNKMEKEMLLRRIESINEIEEHKDNYIKQLSLKINEWCKYVLKELGCKSDNIDEMIYFAEQNNITLTQTPVDFLQQAFVIKRGSEMIDYCIVKFEIKNKEEK